MSSLGARVHPSSRSHAPHPVSHRSRVHHRRPSTPRNPASSTPSLASRALAFASRAVVVVVVVVVVGRSCRRLNLDRSRRARASRRPRVHASRATFALEPPSIRRRARATSRARVCGRRVVARARGRIGPCGLDRAPTHAGVFGYPRRPTRAARESATRATRDASDAR